MIVRARAPLRLGLAGGGTDVSPYCDTFGGCLLNVTIDRYAFASISPRTDDKIVFRAADLEVEDIVECESRLPLEGELRLHRAVYNRVIREFGGRKALPMTLTTHVDSPMGSGLGSSSALVVAMVEAFRELLAAPLGEYDVARLAFEIERRDVGLNGGRQDQYAAAFGGFNFMEFGADDRVIVNPLRVKQSVATELESSLLLFFTGISRESDVVIKDQTAAVAQDGAALEAMHELRADAIAMKEALLFGDVAAVAQILGRSWQAKKRTSKSVSNKRIDKIYDAAMESGAMAGKVSGAGGGGFLMLLVDPLRRPEVIRRLEKEGGGHLSQCRFSSDGAMSWRPRVERFKFGELRP
jgi:D-glycero-alpha-D-manno-heptose-7-phosphate kinase